jgi:hypothetical protein
LDLDLLSPNFLLQSTCCALFYHGLIVPLVPPFFFGPGLALNPAFATSSAPRGQTAHSTSVGSPQRATGPPAAPVSTGPPPRVGSGLPGGRGEPLASKTKQKRVLAVGAAIARLGVPSRPSWHRSFNDLVPLTHGGSSLTIFERGGQGLEVQQCNPYRIIVV